MTMLHIRAFTGPDAEQRAERVGTWFKAIAGYDAAKAWCIERGISLTKATNETVLSTGGFLAPDDFDAAIIAVREAVGAFRQGAEVRPARSVSQIRPRRSGGLTANFVSEGAAIPESALQYDAVSAALKKLAILARTSTELFEDSAADLGEFVTSEVAYAFATTEDDCGFNGDGTSTYTGISGLGSRLAGLKSAVAAANGHNTFLSLDASDMSNVVAGVMAAALPGAAWYTSITGYAQAMCRLAASSGGLTTTLNPDGSIKSANYLGFPVRFSGKLPDVQTTLSGKPMLYFGNLNMSSLLVEQRRKTILAFSFDRPLDQDQLLVRAVVREDIINHTIGDASTRGPVAMLVGG